MDIIASDIIEYVIKIRKHEFQKYIGVGSVFLIKGKKYSYSTFTDEGYYLQLRKYPTFIVPFNEKYNTIKVHAYEIISCFNTKGKINKQSIMFGNWASHCIQFSDTNGSFIKSINELSNEKKRVEILVKIIEVYIDKVGLHRY